MILANIGPEPLRTSDFFYDCGPCQHGSISEEHFSTQKIWELWNIIDQTESHKLPNSFSHGYETTEKIWYNRNTFQLEKIVSEIPKRERTVWLFL